MAPQKILYLFDVSDWNSRMAVAEGARDRGMDVTIGLINGDESAKDKAPDFKIIPLQKQGSNTSIFGGFGLVRDINRLIKEENPDTIHTVTLKYGFLSALAAMPYKTKHKIHTLAGLGYLFRSDEAKSTALRAAMSVPLAQAFKQSNTTLIFQNEDDRDLLIQKRIATPDQSVLIKGSGVHLDQFNAVQGVTKTDESPIVLMPTRLVHEKGVGVFVEAARILKQRGVDAKFQIAGGETDNPKAISRDEMIEMTKDGASEWLGRVEDMPDRMSEASLIVYPSYYGEGIPRVLLEACAAGRAIVTTDNPGCKDAVDHEKNGLIVPIKDPTATADAIECILGDTDMRERMERNSRIKAEREFCIESIVEQTVRVYSDHYLNRGMPHQKLTAET